jgi:hypothetical protein
MVGTLKTLAATGELAAMIKTAASEIKARFSDIHKKHLERWSKEHPSPMPPDGKTVAKELRTGKFSVEEKPLSDALKAGPRRKWNDEEEIDANFFEVISTPAIEAWKRAMQERAEAKRIYKEQIKEAKDTYLDRVLFDNENGFILLRDFQRWKPNADEWEESK